MPSVGCWWACTEPERPHDEKVVYRVGCPKCGMAFITAAKSVKDVHLWMTGPGIYSHIEINSWEEGLRAWNEVTATMHANRGTEPPTSLPGPQPCNMVMSNRQIATDMSAFEKSLDEFLEKNEWG